MSSVKHKVIVAGAPESSTLTQIKQQIGALLTKGEDGVKRVKKCKTETEEVIPGKFEVELVHLEGKTR